MKFPPAECEWNDVGVLPGPGPEGNKHATSMLPSSFFLDANRHSNSCSHEDEDHVLGNGGSLGH